jgi:hypothetical protein
MIAKVFQIADTTQSGDNPTLPYEARLRYGKFGVWCAHNVARMIGHISVWLQ